MTVCSALEQKGLGIKWLLPIQGTVLAFAWRGRGKPWKTSGRVASVLVEILDNA